MAMKRNWTVLLVAAAVLAGASSAWATHNPHLGRFMQRDPLGYPDGMNGYEYCGSAPVSLVDPSGAKLCLNTKDKKEHRKWIKKLLTILDTGVKFDECECVSLESAAGVAGKLVKAIADANETVGIRYSDVWKYSEPVVHVTKKPKRTPQSYFTKEWDARIPEAERRAFPIGEKEQAIVLAHELIHAYYQRIKGKRYSKLVENAHVFKNNLLDAKKDDGQWGTDFKGRPKTRESEYYTVGLRVATDFKRKKKKVEVTYYTGTYTENKIRRQLGHPWKRVSYTKGPVDGARDMSGYEIDWKRKDRK